MDLLNRIGISQLSRPVADWHVHPMLHIDPDRVYNPLSDTIYIDGEHPDYAAVRALVDHTISHDQLADPLKQTLIRDRWLVDDLEKVSEHYYLKFVSLEAHSICNQACYFCPVSMNPRKSYFMPTEVYENIVHQLAEYRSTIQAVFMINYNEPTVDKRFLDQIRLLKAHGLPVAVLTNATGLTPERVDAIVEMGGIRFLSINLSTLDRTRYKTERGRDQLEMVLRNLDYARDKLLAPDMDMVVLGTNNDQHQRDFESIQTYFAGSRFNVKKFEVMDRAGYLPVGLIPSDPMRPLCGCENVGSRPLQHLHITAQANAVMCCEDYDEKYIVGNLNTQTVNEVLTSPALGQMRRWVYGLEDAPEDFMCRKCIFARRRA